MRSEAARAGKSNVGGEVLYMALELSARSWKVLLQWRSGRRRECSVAAGDVAKLLAEIAAAKERLGLPPEALVVSCYEAGRDGFWLDRALRANGIENLVVDSSSIEVPRRSRRRKTDRIDLFKLMGLLLRYAGGERTVWSVVRVPDAQVEDVRQLSRGIERLKTERRRHTMRIQSLLVKEGIRLARIGGRAWAERVQALKLGPYLTCELIQEGERLALVEGQLAALKAERERMVASSPSKIADYTRRLRQLGAVAQESSFVFSVELFGWRTFANRRELRRGRWALPARRSRAARSTTSRASPRPAIGACAPCWWRLPGAGSGSSAEAHSACGGSAGSAPAASARAGSAWWRWRASSWWRCGATWSTASCRKGRP